MVISDLFVYKSVFAHHYFDTWKNYSACSNKGDVFCSSLSTYVKRFSAWLFFITSLLCIVKILACSKQSVFCSSLFTYGENSHLVDFKVKVFFLLIIIRTWRKFSLVCSKQRSVCSSWLFTYGWKKFSDVQNKECFLLHHYSLRADVQIKDVCSSAIHCGERFSRCSRQRFFCSIIIHVHEEMDSE
jgi:hypothetical protein